LFCFRADPLQSGGLDMKDLYTAASGDFLLNSSMHWDHDHARIQPALQDRVCAS
jgi:hypothetical protein